MRSWSIPVGRLFGVDIRLHLTFLILPMFIFWTDYAAHRDRQTDHAIWHSAESFSPASARTNADTCWLPAGWA